MPTFKPHVNIACMFPRLMSKPISCQNTISQSQGFPIQRGPQAQEGHEVPERGRRRLHLVTKIVHLLEKLGVVQLT